ncbi:RNA-binding protein [Clostridium sp. DJ247]|uniref:YlmH family RNA-binding protein n=1 Tax=Clostridium sp. DJ247 TaxID=2726188 RepID=UPI0016277B32|nr:YlmH/Sll1252 family protein [Clostridium sp. DJ247]MBC2580644.1 RNA-binding protein [Clostridium sp. DJ247]MBC2580705.1 RNA-binding protein [Clostridium sp. DJ247]
MNKKDFLNRMNSIENSIASSIYDKIALAQKTNKVIYSGEFYTPNIWMPLESMQNNLGIGIYTYGIFEDAERKIVAFSYNEVWDYPIDLVMIKCSSKFNKLYHKDYLGSVMALGIKREKLGDLILKEDKCYLAASAEISTYIKYNLTSVGKSTCSVDILDREFNEIPLYNFESIVVNVSSLRVDCVVSSLCNISRTKAEDLIRQGKVLINYSEVLRKDKILKNDSVMTIRGYGKFKVIEEAGWTGSGRMKIIVKKFV